MKLPRWLVLSPLVLLAGCTVVPAHYDPAPGPYWAEPVHPHWHPNDSYRAYDWPAPVIRYQPVIVVPRHDGSHRKGDDGRPHRPPHGQMPDGRPHGGRPAEGRERGDRSPPRDGGWAHREPRRDAESGSARERDERPGGERHGRSRDRGRDDDRR